ncbi:hypothetical protein RRG08_025986 [Elysia crispata]|uniref:Uncharacterized protein n=1 Tax=Elysia crispata TaxID=231223 RepID=A0AAE0ZFY7_9GAST|nr:hypothetical protein RRG08_025986 [Elysia crispata]
MLESVLSVACWDQYRVQCVWVDTKFNMLESVLSAACWRRYLLECIGICRKTKRQMTDQYLNTRACQELNFCWNLIRQEGRKNVSRDFLDQWVVCTCQTLDSSCQADLIEIDLRLHRKTAAFRPTRGDGPGTSAAKSERKGIQQQETCV